jgi:protein TonB
MRKPRSRPRVAKAAAPGMPLAMSLPFAAIDASEHNRLLANAIGFSVFLHMVVLAIHFSPIDLPRFDRGPPLEVALVNAKTDTRPSKAEIRAQANLDGGGNTDADRKAKTPLPVPLRDSPAQDLNAANQQVSALENRTREMLTQLRAAAAVTPPTPKPTEAPEIPPLPNANEQMQRTLETMRLEAQIAKQMEAYQKRPKRRFGRRARRGIPLRALVEDWRLKVEDVGNRHYPAVAREKKLYGSLLLTVGIRADGSLESIVVDRSSGKKILDAAAKSIVQMAAPYAPFPGDIRRDTDILYITRTWTFAPGDSLTSQ